jgi:hypothetical protein
VAATDAWRLTVVDGDPRAGVADIADRLAGRSLGLVLAGGGARAFAHVGVLRELEEAGYPVNRIAGASVGAAIAGIYAMSRDGAELEERTFAEFVARNPFNDWTIPKHALTRGVRVRASVDRVTGDAAMEGLVPPAVAGEHRPDEPDPPGAPSRAAPRRHPRVVATARALPADPDRQRPAPDGRRSRRQPARRPPPRARRGTGRRRQHLDGRRLRASGRARGVRRPRVPAWARPCCGP